MGPDNFGYIAHLKWLDFMCPSEILDMDPVILSEVMMMKFRSNIKALIFELFSESPLPLCYSNGLGSIYG